MSTDDPLESSATQGKTSTSKRAVKPHQHERIKDQRRINFFQVDNVFIDEHAAALGVYAVAVYCYLVRHSRDDVAQEYHTEMALTLGISRRQVIRCIQKLEQAGIIEVERIASPRSTVANKRSNFILKHLEPRVIQSRPPVTNSHAPVTDGHGPVTESHGPVTESHTLYEQYVSSNTPSQDMSSQEAISGTKNDEETGTPSPPHSPPASPGVTVTLGAHLPDCTCLACEFSRRRVRPPAAGWKKGR